MTYPTLYSRTSTGAIQTWLIAVDGASYAMITGQINGKKTISTFTVCKGKNKGRSNETTPEQQAILEATSKFNKKKKTGYFENVEDINKLSYVSPMLAKKFFDRKDKVIYPCIIQCKMNGARCVITKTGAFSREGEKFLSIPHILESLEPFFKIYPDAVLDGELFNYELRSKLNELIKLIRKTVKITDNNLNNSKEIVKFYCYDGYNFENYTTDTPYVIRKSWIDKFVCSYPFIKFVESYEIDNEDNLFSLYEKFLLDGQEGGMIRFPNMKYKIGGRSSELLKLKPEDSCEGVIKALYDGNGNWSGVTKTFSIDWNGIIFDATLKCSYEEAAKVKENPENWLEKEVTFLYNGLTGLGKPNFARVDINNCFKN